MFPVKTSCTTNFHSKKHKRHKYIHKQNAQVCVWGPFQGFTFLIILQIIYNNLQGEVFLGINAFETRDAWNKAIGLKNNQDMTNVLEMIIKMRVQWRKVETKKHILGQKRLNGTCGGEAAGMMKLDIRVQSQWWVYQRGNSFLLSRNVSW